MAEPVIAEGEVPITLYLGIPQGYHADLATVSRIGLSFTELVSEIAHDLFPDADIRVEAVDATEGSFGWNTLTRIYLDAKAGVLTGARRYPKVGLLTAYVALRILNNAVDWSQDQIMDWMAGKDAPAEVRGMTRAEMAEIAADIASLIRRGVAEQPADRIFKDAKKDSVVDSVGVTARKAVRPEILIYRPQFDTSRPVEVEAEQHRVRSQDMSVTLISPVLAPGERRWKFATASGEFGAPITDAKFVDDVLSGRANIRLRAGLVLDVAVEIKESSVDGVWHIDHREITRVYGWRDLPTQGDLLDPRADEVQEY